MTTIESFRGSASDAAPPVGAAPALRALWWARKGEWERAHALAQRHEGEPDCDLVHAHLHRQEGDEENARYWYGRAGREPSTVPLGEEWDGIATELLSRG